MFAGQSHENGQVMRIETINAQGSTISTQVASSTFFQIRLDHLQGLIQPAFSLSLPPFRPLRLTQSIPAPIIKR